MLLHVIIAVVVIAAPIFIVAYLMRSTWPIVYAIVGFVSGGLFVFPGVFILDSYPVGSMLGSPIRGFYVLGEYYQANLWPVAGAALQGMAAGAVCGIWRAWRLRKERKNGIT